MNRFVIGTLVGLAAALIVLRLSRRRPASNEPVEPGPAEEQALP